MEYIIGSAIVALAVYLYFRKNKEDKSSKYSGGGSNSEHIKNEPQDK